MKFDVYLREPERFESSYTYPIEKLVDDIARETKPTRVREVLLASIHTAYL